MLNPSIPTIPIENFEIEPDKLVDEGRSQFLHATRNVGIDLQQVESRCSVYDDDVSKMTNARLFARFMSRFTIYNPQANGANNKYNTATTSTTTTSDGDNNTASSPKGKRPPSLDAAWAYWEHITLGRYLVDDGDDSTANNGTGKTYTRAEVGEREKATELYPIWRTPLRDLMAWGVSVRLYFSTLLTLSCFLVVAGVLNLPLVWYFWNFAEEGHKDGIPDAVRGSAVCDDTQWVECNDCNGDYSHVYPEYRLDGQNVRTNTCNYEDWLLPGLFSYAASIILIVLFGIAYFWLQRKAEIVFDEEIQTASDYSIKISNPPRDAVDPDEWRAFFKPYGFENVTLVTVALDNAELINTLVKRRKILKRLRGKLDKEVDMTDEEAVRSAVEASVTHSCCRIPFISTAQELYDKVQTVNEKIRDLAQNDYGAVAVYVTFETERAQRSCLHALSTGKRNVWRNEVDTSKFDGKKIRVQEAAASSKLDVNEWQEMLTEASLQEMSIQLVASRDSVAVEDLLKFRGVKVLSVKEAGEPSDVRWKDLQVSSKVRASQFFITTIMMLVFIGWSGLFMHHLQTNNPTLTPLYIAVTNVVVPKICEFVNGLEYHSTEAARNGSLYIKVALFRCFNSAICLMIITTFINTTSIEDGNESATNLMYTAYCIIYAEMFTVPVIKVIDIMGNIRKHILAPRAADQEEMNGYFSGAKFELAERYSDATKVLFVALFYSAIMPESLFLGAIALMAHFWSGKFCLLRIWRCSPDIGPHLARLSRNYFFSTSLVVHVIMCAYFWSGYPYDNVCQVDGKYQYCDQDMLGQFIFPPLPMFQPDDEAWMTDSQATITSLYSYTSVVMILAGIYVAIKESLIPAIQSIYSSQYEPDGEDQHISFSSVLYRQEVQGYVPQVNERGFEHPLLACDISNIDEDLMGWKDHFYGFDKHNLVHDVRRILGGHDPMKPIFSIVKHWPPTSNKGEATETNDTTTTTSPSPPVKEM